MAEGPNIEPAAEWRAGPPQTIEGRPALCYIRSVEDGHLFVLISADRPGELHLSISHRLNLSDARGHAIPGRLPTWDEIKDARYRFLSETATYGILLPPPGEYVNLFATCIHLHHVEP